MLKPKCKSWYLEAWGSYDDKVYDKKFTKAPAAFIKNYQCALKFLCLTINITSCTFSNNVGFVGEVNILITSNQI